MHINAQSLQKLYSAVGRYVLSMHREALLREKLKLSL